MTEQRVRPFLLSLLALGLVLGGCDLSGSNSGPETVKGPESSIEGGGNAYTFVRLGGDGQPTAIGVSLSEEGFESLTDTSDAHTSSAQSPPSAKHDGASIELDFPEEAPSPYNHVSLDWWPEGHPPPEVYTVAHLDAHFYFISKEERDAIEPGPAQTFPTDEYVPSGYVADSVNVPGDGMHYLNTQAPEFNGEPFTHTFIYGFYQGEATFIEPMVTTDFLSSTSDMTAEVPQPETYQKAGMYPLQYRIVHKEEASEYRILLTNLVQREDS